jgi:hypothetical protein
MNLSRICHEYTAYTELFGEIGESVAYLSGIYRAYYVVWTKEMNPSRI